MANQFQSRTYLGTEVIIIAMVRALRDLPDECLEQQHHRLAVYPATKTAGVHALAELLEFDEIAYQRELIRRKLFVRAALDQAA